MDLSQLRIASLKSLIPHELADFRRIEFLSKRIARDGHVKNPIVVGKPVGKDKLLILDGTTRASALKILNFPDALVQIVDFESPKVKLETWKHLILGTNKEEIMEEAKRLSLNVTPSSREEAISVLKDKKVISSFVLENGEGLVVSNGGPNLETQVRELKKLLTVCYKRSRVYCADYQECLNLAKGTPHGKAVAHLLPNFSKEEILQMAFRGILLPVGVTRFMIPQRILRVDVSNDVLASEVPLEEKNIFLSELIKYRLESRKIRLYQEPVLLLNE